MSPRAPSGSAVIGKGEQGAGILPAVFELTDFINIMADDDDEGRAKAG